MYFNTLYFSTNKHIIIIIIKPMILSVGNVQRVDPQPQGFLVISYLCALVPYHFVPKAIPFRTQVIIIVFDI